MVMMIPLEPWILDSIWLVEVRYELQSHGCNSNMTTRGPLEILGNLFMRVVLICHMNFKASVRVGNKIIKAYFNRLIFPIFYHYKTFSIRL